MADPITVLKEATKDILSEESILKIQTTLNEHISQQIKEKAQLDIDAALAQVDEDHANKVKDLLESIDKNHTQKLNKVVDTLTETHYQKLRTVIKKYESTLNEDAKKFKGEIVTMLSDYLDLYLEETFPKDMLAEAVKNKQASTILTEMRHMLGIDMALAKSAIKEAVLDGKKQIDESTNQIQEIQEKNKTLQEELTKVKAQLVIEQKSAGLPKDKKVYIERMLSNKDPQFIVENFDYTLALFEKSKKDGIQAIKEEAITKSITTTNKIDFIEEEKEVITEQTQGNDPFMKAYMGELGKY